MFVTNNNDFLYLLNNIKLLLKFYWTSYFIFVEDLILTSDISKLKYISKEQSSPYKPCNFIRLNYVQTSKMISKSIIMIVVGLIGCPLLDWYLTTRRCSIMQPSFKVFSPSCEKGVGNPTSTTDMIKLKYISKGDTKKKYISIWQPSPYKSIL